MHRCFASSSLSPVFPESLDFRTKHQTIHHLVTWPLGIFDPLAVNEEPYIQLTSIPEQRTAAMHQSLSQLART
jgi:hypothetical protein